MSLVLGLFLVLVAEGDAPAARMPERTPTMARHPESKDLDVLVLCGGSLFQRPTFVDKWIAPIRLNGCPATAAELVTQLTAAKNRVIESNESVLVVAESAFVELPVSIRYRWKQAVLRTRMGTLEPSEPVTPKERDEILRTVLVEARTPVGAAPLEAGDSSGTVVMEYDLQIGAKSLRPGVKSVLALWGRDRLIYGEIAAGRFELKWDSPLLSGADHGLTFPDVDGDGTPEIAVGSFEINGYRVLTVFDLDGHELTRQADGDCRSTQTVYWVGQPRGVVCPLVAEIIGVEPQPTGGVRILVEPTHDLPYALVFRNGRFLKDESWPANRKSP
jgi:hypothetical protein